MNTIIIFCLISISFILTLIAFYFALFNKEKRQRKQKMKRSKVELIWIFIWLILILIVLFFAFVIKVIFGILAIFLFFKMVQSINLYRDLKDKKR